MKQYYKSLEEYQGISQKELDAKHEAEHRSAVVAMLEEGLGSSKTSRRNFLKLAGFSVATAALAASCENPVKKAIPYLNQPEEIEPGKAIWYASTYYDGRDYCPVLMKVRDGRPIKLEGNELSSITHGGTNARVQAGVISLYDGSARLKGPTAAGESQDWSFLDEVIIKELERISAAGGRMVLLTHTLISPSTLRLLEEFKTRFPGFELVMYDPISYSGMLEANFASFGSRSIPSYRFDKAGLILSFGADFLGTWLSPIAFTRQYAETRALTEGQKKLSRHIQVESSFSLAGSKADLRIPVKPSVLEAGIIHLYNELAGRTGQPAVPAVKSSLDVEALADEIMAHPGETLVVAGTNDPYLQVLINGINDMAGSYGKTIFTGAPDLTKQGQDDAFDALVTSAEKGEVSALFVAGLNPFYHYEAPERFKAAIEKVGLSISFNNFKNESDELMKYSLPVHHMLESWDDAEARPGMLTLAQPGINPLFNTRSMQDSLLKWMGKDIVYRDYIKETWQQRYFGLQSNHTRFEDFWNASLQAGVFEPVTGDPAELPFNTDALGAFTYTPSPAGNLEVDLYESIAMGDGIHANNPWLQELPDPLTKVTWDNFAAISPALAESLKVADGSIIRIQDRLDLPVLIQPGLAEGTITIALGYGRTVAGRVGDRVGGNAWPMVQYKGRTRKYHTAGITVAATSKKMEFARTQTHHSMEGRDIVRETTLDRYLQDPASGNEAHTYAEKHHVSLYRKQEFPGHHWGLFIDLNRCTGCSACAIACQAENNIPVVGKEEVRKRRIMHWIRIDRYFNGDLSNPDVVYQPLMCQHCDNAPCENVCPVAATMHSAEGLNQMAYNRCVGTRYCMNNCPYKVRRFNWFRYVDNDKFEKNNLNEEFGRMVLNPDVTVRERGVVEKCSFCVQRIQEKKLEAKSENRLIRDGEIQPACVQACPAKAMVFGDLNDPESQVSKMVKDERNYHLLEQLHTLPSVGYLTLVRNREGGEVTQDHHHA